MNLHTCFTIYNADMPSTVCYTNKTIRRSFLPLIEEIITMYHNRPNYPFIFAVAGPPGCGKSSIATVLNILFQKRGIHSAVLPLDGFHLKNSVLRNSHIQLNKKAHTLYELKGAHFTYDTDQLNISLQKLSARKEFYWPIYSRKIHEPIERGILVTKKNTFFIIEGNYLFLDKDPWKTFTQYFDQSLFIRAKLKYMQRRIIKRKMKGGFSKKESEVHFNRTDLPNIMEVLHHSNGFELILRQKGRYAYQLLHKQEK